ncbi:MAG: DUF4998 domain-containing protein [Bacteroidales bacterium]|nr:DUF4998 domain-containing protein [Bacteroidales bacterium]
MRKFSAFIAFSALVLVTVLSCDKQDDTYRQYIVPGGYNYPAKASSVVAKAGYHRADVSWATPLDPAVKSVKIYWDNYRDSANVSYADAEDGVVTAHVLGLEERSYTFSIVNFDDKGNKSLASEITVSPYGEGWLSTHAERRVYSAVMKGDDALLTLGTPVDEMVFTRFRYKNKDGQVVVSDPVPMDSVDVRLADALKGKYFEYQSAYCPKNGLDVVWNSNWIKTNTPIYYNLADESWTISVTNNQIRSSEYGPENMFDGNIETRYYSSTNTSYRRAFPKIVSIDTHAESGHVPTVVGVNVVQHQAESKSRYVKAFNFYVSDSEFNPNDSDYSANYGTPVLEASLKQDDAEQQRTFSPVEGDHMAIVFKSSYSTNGFIDVFEFEVLGYVKANAD